MKTTTLFAFTLPVTSTLAFAQDKVINFTKKMPAEFCTEERGLKRWGVNDQFLSSGCKKWSIAGIVLQTYAKSLYLCKKVT